MNLQNDEESFQYIISYLSQFQESNPDAAVYFKLVEDKLESIFICPGFMNVSLRYVRPVMSLNATHLKSGSGGLMYLSTVKTGCNEIYTVAFSIERGNKCYDGSNTFLGHLKSSCPLLHMVHPLQVHNKYGYFTYVSDWDKGLLQALQNNFPKNHSTQCSIHIQHNVLTKFRLKSASTQVHEISKMFLYYQEEKILEKICLLSPAAHDYLVGDAGIEASKWCSNEWVRNTKLPPGYGIVSTNILESLNSMYDEARKLPWLYCLDSVLNSMSS
jgi:Transposase, Mutator family